MFTKLQNLLKESLFDVRNKVSHSKISSYFILGSILASTALFISIDVGNAILQWKNGHIYTIPLEHIGIFGLILSHHLVLLGLKKDSDVKMMMNESSESKSDI